jgi:hypothetical protein
MFWGGIVNFSSGKVGFVGKVLETNFVKWNSGKGFGGIYCPAKVRETFWKVRFSKSFGAKRLLHKSLICRNLKRKSKIHKKFCRRLRIKI